MHPITYLFLFIIVNIIALSHIFKIIKPSFINLHIYLLYFSLGYIYIIEGYMRKITYIYDNTKNSIDDKEKKIKLIYNLIFIYIILILVLFIIVNKFYIKHKY